ncbi:MAG: ABC transporter substrate-binding protein [Gammaproteobacteria bacterium]|nr:ABC transporter substrate-binding protein [Gammaproteobacteria bacterium]MDE2251361.1 ABC transporter substrate-binding protein [Gammaproteobacteria bacterium]
MRSTSRAARTSGLALLLSMVVAGALARAAIASAATPAAATAVAAPVAVVATDPGQLIDTVAQAMLHELDAHRADYRQDPARINELVDRELLPHFDTDYSARLVLGKYWNSATAEQRQRFVAAFYHSLLNNYGRALLDFTADRLKVLPYKGDPGATYATVRTQVRKNDGTIVAVNYSLHRTAKGWMAWDVVIEGISYVKSFRDDFGAEIDAHGVDALIDRLEKQGAGK